MHRLETGSVQGRKTGFKFRSPQSDPSPRGGYRTPACYLANRNLGKDRALKPKMTLLSGMITGSVLLLGCNINLAGANISGKVDADIKVDNKGGIGNNSGNNNTVGTNPNNTNTNTNPGSNPNPVGLQDVTAIRIDANTDTLVVGALMPWESEKRPYDGNNGGNAGGPTLFPTPKPVGEPYAVPTLAAKFQLFATVKGSTQQIQVGLEDPNFTFSFEPDVQMQIERREGWLYPSQGTPAGDVVFKVSYRGDKVVARKTFRVVSAGQVAVEAE